MWGSGLMRGLSMQAESHVFDSKVTDIIDSFLSGSREPADGSYGAVISLMKCLQFFMSPWDPGLLGDFARLQ